jgi:hypothetical protein
MSYTPFNQWCTWLRYRFGTTSTRCTGTGTHNPSLSAIPTAQKQSFAGIGLFLVICVIPGLSRGGSRYICVGHRAFKDVLGLQGHHTSCEISTNYGALVDLIESFESFLRRLEIYTIQSNTAMTEITIKILVELLSVAIPQTKLGRLSTG